MADIVYYAAMSLDGYIATPDGGVGWLSPFEASGDDHGYAGIDGLLMGRRAYEQALKFGP